MKLRYLLTTLVSAAALLFAASCSDDFQITGLSEISVDKSYVTLPEEGGSTPIVVHAVGPWQVDESSIPEGLTISPLSGDAGNTAVTFTTKSFANDVKAEILFTCAGKTQYVQFFQPGDPTLKPQFGEFQEGQYWIMFNVEGKWLVAKPCTAEIGNSGSYAYIFCDEASGSFEDGTLSSTAANVYTFTKTDGGFYVSDSEGGYLWQSGEYNNFYRAKAGGNYVWTVEQISETEFDIATNTSHVVCYSPGYSNMAAYASVGTNIRPYLVPAKDPAPEVIKCENTTFNVEKEGGKFSVPAYINANNVKVEYDAAWLHYFGTDAEGLHFSCDANDGGARTAEVTVTATLGEYTGAVKINIVQAGSIVECSVADFLAAEVGDALYRVTGVITKVAKAEYGNVYITDYSGTAYVYGIGAKGDFEAAGLKEGDIVTLVGKRAEHKGDPQMGGAVLESSQKVEKISCADFKNLEDDKTKSKYYMLTGVVGHADEASAKFDLETYGNFGLNDGTANLYVYGVATGYSADGQGGRKMFSTLGVKEGDKLTILAYKTSYNGTIEAVGFYYSHESAE